MLGGGLYLEVQGYKKSLREKRLDPAILFACVLLSVAITNHLLRFAAGEGLAHKTLLARVASTELDAEKILAASEDAEPARKKRVVVDATPTRMSPGQRFALLVGAALALRIFAAPATSGASMEPQPPGRAHDISDAFQSVAVSDDDERFVVAKVGHEAWKRLTATQRRLEAERLLRALKDMGSRNAVVLDGDSAVVIVQQGRALWVD
jgi:hypothetical protein